MCDDYGVINAPFSGSLAGPVSQKDPAGNQYDGVKLLNDGKKDMMSVQRFRVGTVREGNFSRLPNFCFKNTDAFSERNPSSSQSQNKDKNRILLVEIIAVCSL